MRIVKAYNLAAAHNAAVFSCLREAKRPMITENGEVVIRSDDLTLEVREPFTDPMISKYSPFQKGYHDQYAKQLLFGSEGKDPFEYDYHGRLFHHPGNGCEIDQIAYIIDLLKKVPNSRQAVANTWDPHQDCVIGTSKPCLQTVAVDIAGGRLNLKVTMRSNDMLMAAGCNMYAFVGLQRYIAEQIGVPTGAYVHIALNAHVYPHRDYPNLEPFLKEAGIAAEEVIELLAIWAAKNEEAAALRK